jgi:hypothetical protein
MSATGVSSSDGEASQLINSLLSALAVSARSAAAIPCDEEDKAEGGSGQGGDFSFANSFPEYQTLTNSARGRVGALISRSMQACNPGSPDAWGDDEWGAELDDPNLWESCADACEALLERVNGIIDGNVEVGGDGRLREKVSLEEKGCLVGLFAEFTEFIAAGSPPPPHPQPHPHPLSGNSSQWSRVTRQADGGGEAGPAD